MRQFLHIHLRWTHPLPYGPISGVTEEPLAGAGLDFYGRTPLRMRQPREELPLDLLPGPYPLMVPYDQSFELDFQLSTEAHRCQPNSDRCLCGTATRLQLAIVAWLGRVSLSRTLAFASLLLTFAVCCTALVSSFYANLLLASTTKMHRPKLFSPGLLRRWENTLFPECVQSDLCKPLRIDLTMTRSAHHVDVEINEVCAKTRPVARHIVSGNRVGDGLD